VLVGRWVLNEGNGGLNQGYRRLLAAGVSYAICMTVEHTLGANNGSLRRVCGDGGGSRGKMGPGEVGRGGFRLWMFVTGTRNEASYHSNTCLATCL
jgi:hypothetical protein